jgi:tetratricopeptide (TPR) repeat protein
MFRDVRQRGLARRMAQEGEMKVRVFFCLIASVLLATPARAGGLTLSPQAQQALDDIYRGDPDAGVAAARDIERAQPQSPVGYLLEGEAEWWKFYCASCEIKWGQFDAWHRPREPEDDAYFALADKAIDLARAQIVTSDTADMHVYAGLGYALKARLYSLRDEKRAIAHAGVAGRAEFMRALELDPDMADATAGIGLYNYYIDTLSAIARMLRFFMGLPGGNKQEGIRQMRVGIERGAWMSVDSSFYLARNLRTYDEHYEEALAAAEPLATRYPHNPVFLLLAGNLNAELGRNAKAAEYFHAAQDSPPADAVCAARASDVAGQFLANLH